MKQELTETDEVFFPAGVGNLQDTYQMTHPIYHSIYDLVFLAIKTLREVAVIGVS